MNRMLILMALTLCVSSAFATTKDCEKAINGVISAALFHGRNQADIAYNTNTIDGVKVVGAFFTEHLAKSGKQLNEAKADVITSCN